MPNYEVQNGSHPQQPSGQQPGHPPGHHSGLELDPRLRDAYQRLPNAEPSAAVDRAIHNFARRQPVGGRWIWPASLAASLVLCVILVSQMARLVKPNFSASDIAVRSQDSGQGASPDAQQSTSVPGSDSRSTPAYGTVSQAPQTLNLAADAAPSVPDTPEFWWDQLRDHAANADREGFLATWAVYQQQQQDTPLPEDLNRWIAENQLTDPTPTDG